MAALSLDVELAVVEALIVAQLLTWLSLWDRTVVLRSVHGIT